MIKRNIQSHEEPEVWVEDNSKITANFNIRSVEVDDRVVYIYDSIVSLLGSAYVKNYLLKVLTGDLVDKDIDTEATTSSLVELFSEEEAASLLVDEYASLRANEYPDIAEFADAYVKGDDEAIEAYKAKCLAIKAKYPKGEVSE